MKSELIPLREKTLAVMRELLGPEATEQQVYHSESCILSMCIHPMMMQRIRKRTKDVEVPVVIDDLEAFADHVMTFALSGINAIRRQIYES